MKKTVECIAIRDTHLSESPKLKDLVLLEAIWFDRIKGLYYIDFDNPLSTLLLMRFPELAIDNPQTITVTIN